MITESFEDGSYQDRWRVLWLQGGSLREGTQSGESVPRNEWTVEQRHAAHGSHALHLRSRGDGNTLVTTDDVVDISGDYTLEYSFYTPDPNSRGLKVLAGEVSRYGDRDDLVTRAVPHVHLGSAHRSPNADVHGSFKAPGFNERVPIETYPPNTMNRVRVERRGRTIRGYLNGDRFINGEIDADSIPLDPDRDYRLMLRSSGGYGDRSNVWIDDISFEGPGGGGDVDETRTRTPSPRTTTAPPTRTQRRPSTRTPRPTTTPVQYDLQNARQRTEVEPFDRTLFVLRGVPGADERPAVTTTDYELVDTNRARDALVTYVHGQWETGFDWEQELSYAQEMRGRYGATELWNRAAGLGWDALSAYAMAQVNPTAAVAPVLEALRESTAWAAHEISDPYMEAMSKQTEWTYGYRDIQREVERADSLVDMTADMYEFLQVAWNVADTAEGVSDVVAAARAAYRSSNVISTTLAAGGAAASNVLVLAAVGELVSRGVDTVVAGMEENAKLSAIGHAYSTTRIPVVRRLVELEERRRAKTLSPGEAWELAYLETNHHYMGAFANHGMYKHADAVEQSTLGGLWETIVNVDEAATVLEERASTYQWGGAAAHRAFGQRLRRAMDLTAESINHEAHGAAAAIGGVS
jgi:hypothetical protein